MDHSFSLIRDLLNNYLADDYFGELQLQGIPMSVRQFIEYMAAGNVAVRRSAAPERAAFPDLTDLNITFAQFLDKTVKLDTGNDVALGYLFCERFCKPLVEAAVSKVAQDGQYYAPADAVAFGEVGAASWQEWAAALRQKNVAELWTPVVADDFVEALKDRSLLSFFIRPTPTGQFVMWGPAASSGMGRKLPTRTIPGVGHSVEVTVSRYEEVDGPVVAYEWQAVLTNAGESEPAAAVCGMVYVFERSGGRPLGDLDDLVLAADSMTDDDVLQARAFITQHDDADDLIQASDLCFVWIWERRGGAPKGVGAQCLAAGLADLRRRFKKVRTAIFDVRPSQFVDWTPAVDPPMVAVEKQTAIESLAQYIERLPLDVQTRLIFNRSSDPFHDALLAVGQAGRTSIGEDDDDAPDEDIDVDLWRDELIRLFAVAGFDDLVTDLKDEVESYLEVESALKYLIFDSQVHYLRSVSLHELNRVQSFRIQPVDLQDALDGIAGLEEFVETLPDDMDVAGAFLAGPTFIVAVVASTPFGDLLEYFSLIPKPRPINISRFFDAIQ